MIFIFRWKVRLLTSLSNMHACQTFYSFEANDIRNSKLECLNCHFECHIKLKNKFLEWFEVQVIWISWFRIVLGFGTFFVSKVRTTPRNMCLTKIFCLINKTESNCASNFSDVSRPTCAPNCSLRFLFRSDKAGIAPLLDVDDMVMYKKPDWKCVFCYVQSIYRRFKNED